MGDSGDRANKKKTVTAARRRWRDANNEEKNLSTQPTGTLAVRKPKRGKEWKQAAQKENTIKSGTPGADDSIVKVTMENLPLYVTGEDLGALLGSIGEVVAAKLKKTRKGKSSGVAEINFRSRKDAFSAIGKLSGISLDGHSISLSLVSSTVASTQTEAKRRIETSSVPGSLKRRNEAKSSPKVEPSRPKEKEKQKYVVKPQQRKAKTTIEGARGGRGRGRGRGRGGGRGGGKIMKTAAELDREMDEYRLDS